MCREVLFTLSMVCQIVDLYGCTWTCHRVSFMTIHIVQLNFLRRTQVMQNFKLCFERFLFHKIFCLKEALDEKAE